MTTTQRVERVLLLIELRREVEEVRRVIQLAKDDEYKEGALKALTNVFAIIDEKRRITDQNGEPSIQEKLGLGNIDQEGFLFTIDDGFCAWQYELKPKSDDLSINDIAMKLFNQFDSPIDHGKSVR